MRRFRSAIVTGLFVVGLAVPAAAHAARERREVQRTFREMNELASSVQQPRGAAGVERRVTINGATMFFKKHSEQGTLDEVMTKVATECGSGNEAVAFGLGEAALDDGKPSRTSKLEKVYSQEGEGGVRASLCIFAKDGNHEDEARRVRYTLALRREDGSIAVTTVVSASGNPLQELFPAEGDAPGGDFSEIARPAEARRTMTAIVGNGEHVVRVYESTLSPEASVESYDAKMHALGFATTGSLEDARMYRKDGKSWVASFRGTTDGSTIALTPFEGPASPPSE
jgi:hypothetical protein